MVKCLTDEERNTIAIIQLGKELNKALNKFESAWKEPHLLVKSDDSNTIFRTPDYPGSMELREFISSLPNDVPDSFYHKETGTWEVKE